MTVFADSGHLLSMERPAETSAALRAWVEDDALAAAA
jgi:hypothetical protein